ncbi:PhzF family phenazine biosynthesis protein [Companilactobacillus jidongensis]|uniref:PhzF family phenazine biosynthesis protein n=1 Tax=Companilactobacillus jidongensis TaxID=2486006 RepID=UPI000F77E784|nr:PhzF family phenazine biosynthesis protein [Companilactobacillus jidongensis]
MKGYIVDAFTDEIFKGNPAAVFVMDKWPSDELMQKIAIENNLSETAFTVKNGKKYKLRWFTPGGEIDLCGHATLATGFILLNYYEIELNQITFETMSGELAVTKKNDLYEMNFPSYELKKVPVTEEMEDSIGTQIKEAYLGRDLLCVVDSPATVSNLKLNFDSMVKLDGLLMNVTARGNKYDCVSRSFAPKLDIQEDPVCGSGHCHIVPYWAKRLDKKDIVAYQDSERTGILYCRYEGDRTYLSGHAVLYSITKVFI